MAISKENVVIVGSGNIAQYMLEEFVADGTYHVVIVSRTPRDYFDRPEVTFHKIGKYSKDEILWALDSYKATAVISTLQSPDAVFYNTVHESILHACRDSQSCKRMVSSEYMGNLRDCNFTPRGNYYVRQPFRNTLAKQSDVKWTLVNQGWLGDYFVQPEDGSKSYMRPFPEGWPINLEQTSVRIIGTGNEPIGWTAARDMAKAVVKLIPHHDWPDHTYVFGELGTWNSAVEKLEKFLGRKLERVYRSEKDMQDALIQSEDRARWYTATMDEWSFVGGTAVPREEALEYSKKYFSDVHFRNIEEILEDSKKVQIL